MNRVSEYTGYKQSEPCNFIVDPKLVQIPHIRALAYPYEKQSAMISSCSSPDESKMEFQDLLEDYQSFPLIARVFGVADNRMEAVFQLFLTHASLLPALSPRDLHLLRLSIILCPKYCEQISEFLELKKPLNLDDISTSIYWKDIIAFAEDNQVVIMTLPVNDSKMYFGEEAFLLFEWALRRKKMPDHLRSLRMNIVMSRANAGRATNLVEGYAKSDLPLPEALAICLTGDSIWAPGRDQSIVSDALARVASFRDKSTADALSKLSRCPEQIKSAFVRGLGVEYFLQPYPSDNDGLFDQTTMYDWGRNDFYMLTLLLKTPPEDAGRLLPVILTRRTVGRKPAGYGSQLEIFFDLVEHDSVLCDALCVLARARYGQYSPGFRKNIYRILRKHATTYNSATTVYLKEFMKGYEDLILEECQTEPVDINLMDVEPSCSDPTIPQPDNSSSATVSEEETGHRRLRRSLEKAFNDTSFLEVALKFLNKYWVDRIGSDEDEKRIAITDDLSELTCRLIIAVDKCGSGVTKAQESYIYTDLFDIFRNAFPAAKKSGIRLELLCSHVRGSAARQSWLYGKDKGMLMRVITPTPHITRAIVANLHPEDIAKKTEYWAPIFSSQHKYEVKDYHRRVGKPSGFKIMQDLISCGVADDNYYFDNLAVEERRDDRGGTVSVFEIPDGATLRQLSPLFLRKNTGIILLMTMANSTPLLRILADFRQLFVNRRFQSGYFHHIVDASDFASRILQWGIDATIESDFHHFVTEDIMSTVKPARVMELLKPFSDHRSQINSILSFCNRISTSLSEDSMVNALHDCLNLEGVNHDQRLQRLKGKRCDTAPGFHRPVCNLGHILAGKDMALETVEMKFEENDLWESSFSDFS